MLAMSAVADGSVEVVYSAHNTEHAFPHEVPIVLKEFLRVLKSEGFLMVTCPELQTAAEFVPSDKLNEPAYQSPAGPITPLHIQYGYRPALASGNHYMGHKCGFTLKTLVEELRGVAFQTVGAKRRQAGFGLGALGVKAALPEDLLRAMANRYIYRRNFSIKPHTRTAMQRQVNLDG